MTTGRPGTGPRAKPHRDIIETDGPALPVPQPRFVPVVRHEPMRRSTRAERMEEIHLPFQRFLTNWDFPDAELTDEELRARRRTKGRG
jgi:hypothetical protein